MSGPTVLVMAAGEGTRMRSSLPKMLHPVCGRPMVLWPIRAALDAGADRVGVIVSPSNDLPLPDGVEAFVQPQPDGTGGALRAAIPAIESSDTVAVIPGDHPMISGPVLASLLETHRSSQAAATLMTVELGDPAAYGRVVRDGSGEVDRIVETKHSEDVSPEVLAIREISTATFVFEGKPLAAALAELEPDAKTGEYYLGDVLPVMRAGGLRVVAHREDDPSVNLGVNDRTELAVATAGARRAILDGHMRAGVTIVDPDCTWIDADVEIEPDATIEPGTTLRGRTRIAAGCVIGPHSTLTDTEVGAGSTIVHSYLSECVVEEGCPIGPFAHVRPGTRLRKGAKAGSFVEIKNSDVGEGAKVPHLTYLGDADVGERANIGAGTITANYDGFRKYRTKIGERARISVNSSLVAPVDVGDDAYTGAGAVIKEDVPPGALGVTRGEQRNIEGYAQKRAKQAEEPEKPS